jgi:hypothetical protein
MHAWGPRSFDVHGCCLMERWPTCKRQQKIADTWPHVWCPHGEGRQSCTTPWSFVCVDSTVNTPMHARTHDSTHTHTRTHSLTHSHAHFPTLAHTRSRARVQVDAFVEPLSRSRGNSDARDDIPMTTTTTKGSTRSRPDSTHSSDGGAAKGTGAGAAFLDSWFSTSRAKSKSPDDGAGEVTPTSLTSSLPASVLRSVALVARHNIALTIARIPSPHHSHLDSFDDSIALDHSASFTASRGDCISLTLTLATTHSPPPIKHAFFGNDCRSALLRSQSTMTHQRSRSHGHAAEVTDLRRRYSDSAAEMVDQLVADLAPLLDRKVIENCLFASRTFMGGADGPFVCFTRRAPAPPTHSLTHSL